jgi:hypothetical protein
LAKAFIQAVKLGLSIKKRYFSLRKGKHTEKIYCVPAGSVVVTVDPGSKTNLSSALLCYPKNSILQAKRGN